MSVDPFSPLPTPPARSAPPGAAGGVLAYLLPLLPRVKAALAYAPYAGALGFALLAAYQFRRHDYARLLEEAFAALVVLGLDAKVDALRAKITGPVP